MNKTRYDYLGGDPDSLDDAAFEQAAIRDAIRALCSVWQWGSSDPVVISGLTGAVVGANTIYQPGYIVVDSEPYYVAGGTFPTGSSLGINITPTYDSAGDEVFEDLATNQTYEVRQGTLEIYTGAQIDFTDMISLRDRFSSLGVVVNGETGWSPFPTLDVQWSAPGSYLGLPNATGYRKNKLGDVELRGVLQRSGAHSVAFTLPVGFRPNSVQIFTSHVFDGSFFSLLGFIMIKPNGEVLFYDQAGTAGDISLCGIKFSI